MLRYLILKLWEGFFHKAIAQSGCLKIGDLENAAGQKAYLDFAMKFTGTVNLEEFKEKMEKMSATEIVEMYKSIPQGMQGITGRANTDDFFPAESFR